MPSGTSKDNGLYDALGIAPDASESEIKKAYKKMAVKHHPDKGGDEATFKEISRAYEILSDAEKRQIYDRYGEEGLEVLHIVILDGFVLFSFRALLPPSLKFLTRVVGTVSARRRNGWRKLGGGHLQHVLRR
eukprot:1171114-Rhodomonas_salina.1